MSGQRGPDEHQLDFSLEEYNQRIDAVRKRMSDRGADALLVDQFEHLVYLFGYLPTAALYQACLLPIDGPPRMLVRGLDMPTFRRQSWVEDVTAYSDWEDPIELIGAMAQELGISRLALETDSNFLTIKRYQQLRRSLPQVEIIDFSSILWELRLIKSQAEIGYLREAARIADASLLVARDAAGEGQNVRDVAAAAYSAALALGADNGRIALFASGASSDALHGRLGSDRLSRGDVLHLELIPQVRGYSARTMRSISIGAPSEERQRVAHRLIAIQDEQIAAMRPGAVASEIDAICRERVLTEGLRSEYPSITAYTLGYHATPRTSDLTRALMPGESWSLAEGMVFHVYIWAQGLAFSETVHITDKGSERLTRSERRLHVR